MHRTWKDNQVKELIVIPARYASSRFPGKPLEKILGKSLIQRVWERCAKAVGKQSVCVATESNLIREHCENVGIQVVMTSDTCPTGTDRVHEVALIRKADIYLNVQGDEPMVRPEDILRVLEAARRQPDKIWNAMTPIQEEGEFRSPNVPKAVVSPEGKLLYMSRAPIPTDKSHSFRKAWKQICIYAFQRKALDAFANTGRKTPLEEIEDIEILRFLELGLEVSMVEVSSGSIAVDIPEDIPRVEELLRQEDS